MGPFVSNSILKELLAVNKQMLGVLQQMANDQQALDAAIQANTTEVAQYITDVQALVAALEAKGVATDFTNEIQQLGASQSQLQAADAAAVANNNPPAPTAGSTDSGTPAAS